MNKFLLKNLLFRLGILVAIVAGGLLLGFFFVGKIGQANETILNDRQQLANFSYMVNSLSRLEKDVQDAQAAARVLDRILPKRDELLARLPEFDALARQNGLLQSISLSSETPASEGQLGNINASFQIAGSLTSFINYIDVLRKNILVTFSELSFAAGEHIDNPDTRINIGASIPVR